MELPNGIGDLLTNVLDHVPISLSMVDNVKDTYYHIYIYIDVYIYIYQIFHSK